MRVSTEYRFILWHELYTAAYCELVIRWNWNFLNDCKLCQVWSAEVCSRLGFIGNEAEVSAVMNLRKVFFFNFHSTNHIFANIEMKYEYWLVNMFSALRAYEIVRF